VGRLGGSFVRKQIRGCLKITKIFFGERKVGYLQVYLLGGGTGWGKTRLESSGKVLGRERQGGERGGVLDKGRGMELETLAGLENKRTKKGYIKEDRSQMRGKFREAVQSCEPSED